VSEEDARYIQAMYDAEIRSMDFTFYRFMMELVNIDLYEDSLIILTSDHGEEFGEHGKHATHSHTLYDELLHVPLLIKLPHAKLRQTRINKMVRSIDILPTILDVLNINAPPVLEGISLMDVARKKENRDLIAVGKIIQKEGKHAVRTDEWKLYEGALFDLKNDPLEQFDLSQSNPSTVKALSDILKVIIQRKSAAKAHAADLSEETLSDLKALGYID